MSICIKISKEDLKKQCEDIIGEDLTGEKVKDVLRDLETYAECNIYYGCIDDDLLEDTF